MTGKRSPYETLLVLEAMVAQHEADAAARLQRRRVVARWLTVLGFIVIVALVVINAVLWSGATRVHV